MSDNPVDDFAYIFEDKLPTTNYTRIIAASLLLTKIDYFPIYLSTILRKELTFPENL